MNSLSYSVLATGAVAAIVVSAIGLPSFEPGVAHDEITGSIKGDRKGGYVLERNGQAVCSMRRGAQIAPRVYRLDASTACEPALAGFETALYWTDIGNGGVVISGTNGPIIEFAESDGAGLESIEPANPLFSLTRSDR